MRDNVRILLESSDFYLKESKAILPKFQTVLTPEEQLQILGQLRSLQQKIAFEIREIDKALEAEGLSE